MFLLIQAEECNEKDRCHEIEPSVTTGAVHYLYIQVRPWWTVGDVHPSFLVGSVFMTYHKVMDRKGLSGIARD